MICFLWSFSVLWFRLQDLQVSHIDSDHFFNFILEYWVDWELNFIIVFWFVLCEVIMVSWLGSRVLKVSYVVLGIFCFFLIEYIFYFNIGLIDNLTIIFLFALYGVISVYWPKLTWVIFLSLFLFIYFNVILQHLVNWEYDFFFMGLSRSYNLGHELGRLTRGFFCPFLVDFSF